MVRIDLEHVWLPVVPRVELAPRLVLDRGGINVLLGAAAGGRSACVDVVTGSLRPAAGRVLFDDCDVTRQAPAVRNVARVFGAPTVYPGLSVRANLMLPQRRRGAARLAAAARAGDVARILGLTDDLDRPAGGLPAAVRQRVALGRAFVRADAAAILLDDPLAMVDPRERASLRAAVMTLASEVRATVVWASGDVDDALTAAVRVVVIDAGRVVQDGPPDLLLRAPATTALAAALGEPPMNLLAVEVRAGCLRVASAQLPIAATVAARVASAAHLQLGVRAHDLRLVPASRPNALVAQLHGVEHRGSCKVATLRTETLSLRVVCDLSQQLVPGYRYHVEIPPDGTCLYADGVLAHG